MFFKTDAASAADYTSRGMGAFTYESKGKRMTMAYHEVALHFGGVPRMNTFSKLYLALEAFAPVRRLRAAGNSLQFFPESAKYARVD